jgi:tripartite-type tricarboxylate transporter receptor subunit TctC
MSMKCAARCLLISCALLTGANAHAQNFPSKPIRIIAPSPPGGPVDVMARLVADHMTQALGQTVTQALGQTVIVENRTGAGAIVGSRAVASAEPDGYTLLLGASGSLAVTPALYKNAGYDPVKSFAPVAAVSQGPLVLAVNPSVPAKTVAELVAYARANPGKLNYGSGTGVTPHMGWGLFTLLTRTKVVHIPYQGAAPAITDLLAGQTHFIVEAPGTLLPHLQQGKLRALAVTGQTRSAEFPDLPTMVESGYPDFVITFWSGVVAPAGTPAAVIARLNAVINDGLRSSAMKARLAKYQVEPRLDSPQDFGAFIASEAKKWADVIVATGIKVE